MDLSHLRKWFEQNESQIQNDYFHFLRFPSISTDAKYKQECLKTATWLKEYIQTIGMYATLWESPGLPVVFAEYNKAGAHRPTILIYQHYDVQPVDPLELWETPPFEPTMKEGKVYARGASDNKGQCFLTITAIKALLDLIKDLQINIKLFIEGEEESGGVGTHVVLQQKKKELTADYAFILDFEVPKKDMPAINVGYRGLAAFEIECTNASVDLHSGNHGGIALNPNRILTEILAKCWDKKGRVTIPHFYDDIEEWQEDDLKKIDFSFDEEAYKREFGVGAFCPNETGKIREANWLLPTLEINGMWGGYTGSGFKTVIPAKAYAKVSCRLVAGQDPKKIQHHFEEFFQQHTPKGAEINLSFHHGAEGFRVPISASVTKNVVKSYEEVFEKPCRYVLTGGSVPIVKDFVEATGAQPVLFGFALATDNIHAPNEHFCWDLFKLGYLTMANAILHVATLGKKDAK